MTLQEAITYGRRLQEDTNIMLDKRDGEFHVIRIDAVEHWKKHYENIAEVRIKIEVTML